MLVFYQAEVDRLVAALSRDRGAFLIVGPRGVGKSTLARSVAEHPEIARSYGERRFRVDASAVHSYSELVAALAAAVGVAMGAGVDAAIVNRLLEGPALLTIDDLELSQGDDLVAADELAADLVRTPTVALLVTTRAVTGAFSIRWREILRLGAVDRQTATRAFVDIAGERFAADPRVGQVLDAIGDLPGAIELAARRARVESSLDPILQGLEAFTDTESSAGPAAAAALHAIDTPDVRSALALLEAFPNGLSDDVLARMSARTRAALETLIERALAVREDGRVHSRSATAAGADQRSLPPDAQVVIAHYVQLLEDRAPRVGSSDAGGEALASLTVEATNIEQAVRLGLRDATPEAIRAADLFGNVMRFAGVGSLDLLDRAADAARARGDATMQAALLTRVGETALARSDYGRAARGFTEALDIYRGKGDQLGIARCLRGRAQVEFARNRWKESGELFMEALRTSRSADDRLGTAVSTERLGDIASVLDLTAEAKRRYEEALQLYRQLGNRRGEADCLHSLGEIALAAKDYDRATALLTEAGDLHGSIGNLLGVANSYFRRGDVAFDRTEAPEIRDADARLLYEQAMATYVSIGDIRGQANAVLRLGELDAEIGRPGSAAAQFHRALELQRRSGNLLGQAGCIMRLADVEVSAGNTDAARRMYREALALYRQLGVHDSVGHVSRYLARIAEHSEERDEYVESARTAWSAVEQSDRIKELDEEFGPTGSTGPSVRKA